MKRKILEHILGMVVITVLLLTAAVVYRLYAEKPETTATTPKPSTAIRIPVFFNPNDPFERALLRDLLTLHYSDRATEADSLLKNALGKEFLLDIRARQALYVKQFVTLKTLPGLLGMFGSFLLLYCAILIVTYYGVQTLGLLKFIKKKQTTHAGHGTSKPPNDTVRMRLRTVLFAAGKIVGTGILFCPAYVIAYSIKSDFDTGSWFFMLLLALVSNGLLITYAHKFYTLLLAESRKGYVETAVVKNLDADYRIGGAITWSRIVAPRKRFPGHIVQHIFANAAHQYRSTIKEQASFLVTGLIIIEMALNIHGHLNYELLRQLLYGNYDFVAAILLGIFLTVKFTEIAVDYLEYRASVRYENVA